MIQNLLLIGAFIILGIIILSVNNIIFSNNTAIMENEIQITGIGLAQQLMDEITSRGFDENTLGGQFIQFPTQLTPESSFGPESGEPPFDDVDDYHNYSTTINTPRVDGYQLDVVISYASPLSPINDVSFRTFLKRVKIIATNPKYMHNPDSLSFSSIVTYYK